jgi:hypothetical protein
MPLHMNLPDGTTVIRYKTSTLIRQGRCNILILDVVRQQFLEAMGAMERPYETEADGGQDDRVM